MEPAVCYRRVQHTLAVYERVYTWWTETLFRWNFAVINAIHQSWNDAPHVLFCGHPLPVVSAKMASSRLFVSHQLLDALKISYFGSLDSVVVWIGESTLAAPCVSKFLRNINLSTRPITIRIVFSRESVHCAFKFKRPVSIISYPIAESHQTKEFRTFSKVKVPLITMGTIPINFLKCKRKVRSLKSRTYHTVISSPKNGSTNRVRSALNIYDWAVDNIKIEDLHRLPFKWCAHLFMVRSQTVVMEWWSRWLLSRRKAIPLSRHGQKFAFVTHNIAQTASLWWLASASRVFFHQTDGSGSTRLLQYIAIIENHTIVEITDDNAVRQSRCFVCIT